MVGHYILRKIIGVLIIVPILAAQYFISRYAGGKWKYLIPALLLIVLAILLFTKVISVGSFFIILIIGELVLFAETGMSEREKNN
ncbi:hypothetical protein [Staphylococcus pettenkoferi]|uniref:Uncharacterized protein n=1 Tax=Staphylococcus pettenkoferi TaxID=170573 RepID=A0ABT4BLU9_9STAP|nr:hypothetical protein [Staphylococcus pettenkoferi]MCY1565306.1 hypothetical protein [Staphylococcus pettenkoferi]MCY1572490.1 hypothetical protein [Staphylococcus pettenkoferi]MCY1583119.1 hypothetical protein [Staphylococcus pettenkoferi]MCY1591179.1 hypothetical protein [Staphylococcus pettenkoferi]MCY1592669.1 hypothetical protein [Staphylococcus pettenkoferi]